jgi:hypothetical protein
MSAASFMVSPEWPLILLNLHGEVLIAINAVKLSRMSWSGLRSLAVAPKVEANYVSFQLMLGSPR